MCQYVVGYISLHPTLNTSLYNYIQFLMGYILLQKGCDISYGIYT